MCFFIRKEKGNQKQDTKEDSYSYYSVIKTRPDCMEIFYRSTWQWNKIFDHDEIPIKMSPDEAYKRAYTPELFYEKLNRVVIESFQNFKYGRL